MNSADKNKSLHESVNETSMNLLYQNLPSCVLTNAGLSSESGNPSTIKDYLLNVLPAWDTRKIDTDLKSYMSLNYNRKRIIKPVRSCGRKTALSQTALRKLGLHGLPKTAVTYEEAKVMNKLWESYMATNLDLKFLNKQSCRGIYTGSSLDSVSSSLLKADYHGALIKVIASKNPSLVGHTGIVIFDTKYTFQIVEMDDVVRTIQKEPCVFEFRLGGYKFKIFGKYFCIRNSERPTKKIKTAMFPVL